MTFMHDKSGNFAMYAAILAMPVLGGVGLALDYSNAIRVRSELQNAADDAVLAAATANNLSDRQRKTLADKVFKGNFTSTEDGKRFNGTFTVLSDGYRYEAQGRVKSVFMQLMGDEYTKVSVLAEVGRTEKELEVAMVLDTTGSMAADMPAMKAAAKQLVNTLYAATGSNVRVAVVPFVASVNVGKLLKLANLDRNGDSRWHATFLENRNVYFDSASTCGSPSLPDGGSTEERADLIPNLFAPWLTDLLGVSVAHAQSAPGPNLGAFPAGWSSDGPCGYFTPVKLSHWDFYQDNPGLVWKGCVEARAGDYDVSDDMPKSTDPDTLWVPYFWPDEEPRGSPTMTHNHYFTDSYLAIQPNAPINGYNWAWTRNPIKYDGTRSFTTDTSASDTLGPS